MDTRQLRYFVAVCQLKKLSHAADHCNVAASALSHHIANLESELSTSLFIRKPRGMEVTAAGLKLLAHAESILAAIDSAVSDVKSGQTEVTGNIAIGMPYSVIKVIGSDLMREVMNSYPKLRLVLREGLSGVTFHALTTGEVDLALVYNPPGDERTSRVPLIEEELFCLGHRSIIGDTSAPITFEAMADLPLALLQTGALSRALLDNPSALGRLEANANIQLASIAGTLGALTDGLACTLGPKVMVSEQLRAGILSARPVSDPAPMRTLYLVTTQDRKPTIALETMTSLLIDLVRDAVTDGRWEAARLTESMLKPG